MLGFLMACSPVRSKTSERLISADIHTSTYNYKYTFSVELVPVCRGDVVCIHPSLARKHGHIKQLAVCSQVGSTIKFIDPTTLQTAEVRVCNVDAVCMQCDAMCMQCDAM